MTIQNRTTLKSYFETGDTPTEAQFENLIDSIVLHVTDNNTTKIEAINEIDTDGVTINGFMKVDNDTVTITPTDTTTAVTISGQVTGNMTGLYVLNTGTDTADACRLRVSSKNGDAFIALEANTIGKFSFGYDQSDDKVKFYEVWGSGSAWMTYDNTNNVVSLGGEVLDADAILSFDGSTKAFKLPTLTTTQRDALTPSNGMLIYNETLNKFQGYENGAWANLI